MEELESLLNISSIVSPKEDINQKLQNLAEVLMNEYVIVNGTYEYRPIEIEFYIYDKDVHADEHVYARNAKAGQLYLHKMGIDICFKSSMETGKFGGVLIRAIEREDNMYFVGPRICSYELINTATSLCRVKKSEVKLECQVIESERIGLNEWKDSKSDWKDEYYNKKYRFVRDGLKEVKMEVPKYDFRETKLIANTKTFKF